MRKTILEVVVGSTLHGTAVLDGLEDLDIMAVVLESKEEFIGLYPEDTWTHRTKPQGVRSEAGDVDHVSYGLRKYLRLAMRGNPTILLALFARDPFIGVPNVPSATGLATFDGAAPQTGMSQPTKVAVSMRTLSTCHHHS